MKEKDVGSEKNRQLFVRERPLGRSGVLRMAALWRPRGFSVCVGGVGRNERGRPQPRSLLSLCPSVCSTTSTLCCGVRRMPSSVERSIHIEPLTTRSCVYSLRLVVHTSGKMSEYITTMPDSLHPDSLHPPTQQDWKACRELSPRCTNLRPPQHATPQQTETLHDS